MPSDAQSTRGVTVLLRPSCGCFGRIGDQRVTARTVAAVVIAALAVFILGNAAQTPKVARPAAGAAGWARDLGPVELTVVVPSTPAELARLPGAPTPFAHADPFGRATIQVVGHTPAAVLLGADRLLAGGPGSSASLAGGPVRCERHARNGMPQAQDPVERSHHGHDIARSRASLDSSTCPAAPDSPTWGRARHRRPVSSHASWSPSSSFHSGAAA
jgi:hypothetical protein